MVKRIKGITLVELLISITVFSILLLILSQVWISIQRDTFIQKTDIELERSLSNVITNLRSSIQRAIVIYTPGMTISINDTSGSKYSVGNYSFDTSTQGIVLVSPITNNNYRFDIFVVRSRTGSLYDPANPNAKILLYYSKVISWTPNYNQGNITNFVKNFTFTSSESPKVLADYIASNGFKYKYLYLDSQSGTYSFFELTSATYTPGKKVQQLEVSIKLQKRWGQFIREKSTTLRFSPITF
ncbi:MAG: hypothetical protein CBR30_00990 [Dictyoglomus sp. NZ13-RE01]|nr:MAG: hypothetical protein CBR30_00990 [Dictyoglomus sp. NZ13-RE01]